MYCFFPKEERGAGVIQVEGYGDHFKFLVPATYHKAESFRQKVVDEKRVLVLKKASGIRGISIGTNWEYLRFPVFLRTLGIFFSAGYNSAFCVGIIGRRF